MSDSITINIQDKDTFLWYTQYQSYYNTAQNNIDNNTDIENTGNSPNEEITDNLEKSELTNNNENTDNQEDITKGQEKKLGQYASTMSYMSSSISFIQIQLKELKKQIKQKEKAIEEKQSKLEQKEKLYQKEMDETFAKAYKEQEKKQEQYNELVKKFQTDYKDGKFGNISYAQAFEKMLASSDIDMTEIDINENIGLKNEIDNLHNTISMLKTNLSNLKQEYQSKLNTINTFTNSYNGIVKNYNSTREELLNSITDENTITAQTATPPLEGVTETDTTEDVSEVSPINNIAPAQSIDWKALYVEGKGINFNNLANLIKNPDRNETTYASWLCPGFSIEHICKKFDIESNSEAREILNIIKSNPVAYTEMTTRPVLKNSFLSTLQTTISLEMFASIDLDGDGFISKDEANKLIEVQNQYNEIISTLKGKDGKITESSVENAIKHYKKTDGDAYNSITVMLQFALDMVKNKMQGTKTWDGKKAYGKGDFEALFEAELHNRIKSRMGYTATDCICSYTGGKKTVVNGVDVVITRNAIISDYELDFFDKYFEENPDASRLDMSSAVIALIETNNGTIKNDPRNFNTYWASATPFEPDWELAERLNIELHGQFDNNGNFKGWFPANTTIYTYIQPDTGEETQITLCNVHNCDQSKLANNYIRTYLYPKYLLGKITKEQYDRARREIYEMAWMTSPCHYKMSEQEYYEKFAAISNFDYNTEELRK